LNTRKNICFLITSLNSGGAERVVASLSNEFIDDYDVHLILFYRNNNFYELDKRIRMYTIFNEPRISKNIFSSVLLNSSLLLKSLRYIKKWKIELMISFTTNVNILSLIISYFLLVPCIISERNNPNIYIPNKIWRFLRNKTYKLAKNLVVQTDFSKKIFSSIVNENKIVVIPNAVDLSLLSRRVNYINRENILLTVGRLDENKNQKLIIQAFKNLNLVNWKLFIIGDGVLRNSLQRLVKLYSLESKIFFLGNVKNISDFYNVAKIFVFSSRSEGFPNALLEAFSFGIPCISTNCNSGPAEIISDSNSGILIDVDDIGALEQELLKLCSNEDLCKRLSINALKSANRFSMGSILQQWSFIINQSLR